MLPLLGNPFSIVVSMEKEFTSVKLTGIDEVIQELIPLFEKSKIVLFEGHMGAGKTTFINRLCHHLGIEGETSSPTFSIVNEYITKSQDIIYHFDFYRLKSEEEAYDLGYEDYLYSGNLCLIEWPEKVESLLPEDVITIHIEGYGEDRTIKFAY